MIVTQHNSPPIILTSQTYHAYTLKSYIHFLNHAMIICSSVKIITLHTHTHKKTNLKIPDSLYKQLLQRHNT